MAGYNTWFPTWKKALIEGIRIFVPAFLGGLWLQIELGSNGFDDIWSWLKAALFAAAFAGFKALIKWIREDFGKGNYRHWSYKIPV